MKKLRNIKQKTEKYKKNKKHKTCNKLNNKFKHKLKQFNNSKKRKYTKNIFQQNRPTQSLIRIPH